MRVSVAVLGLALLLTSEARATVTFDVNGTDDVPAGGALGVCETAPGDHVCTLRAAVMAAQAIWLSKNPDDVIINLPAGTFTLTIAPSGSFDTTGSKGNLYVYGNVKVTGAGPGKTIVDANHLDRAFYVASPSIVTVSNLTIRNGQPTMFVFGGGGVYEEQNVTLTLDHVSIETCTTVNSGLGGCVLSQATLIVTDSTLTGCTAGFGGGIGALTGSLSVSRSTITTNTATSTDGGGIWTYVGASIDHSSIVHNMALTGRGGGVSNVGGALAVWNTTFGYNSSSTKAGGIDVQPPTTSAVLKNVTIAGNTVGLGENIDADAGGIAAGVNVQLYNSIMHANSNDYSRVVTNCTGSITSNGHNIITDATGCSITGAYSTSDPQLGLMQDNGGPGVTFEPAPASPPVNAGTGGCSDPLANPLTDDERGVTRPIGMYCDLGAVELEPPGDVNGDGNVNVADVFYLINFLFAGGPVPKGRANVNGSGGIDVADVFYLVNFLFAGGPPPAF